MQLLQILCKCTNSKKIIELDAHLGCVTLGIALNGLTNDGHVWTWDHKEENILKLKNMLKEANLENKVRPTNEIIYFLTFLVFEFFSWK